MKKSFILIGVLVALTSVLVTFVFLPRELSVQIPQAQIQQKIDAEFPIQEEMLFLTAELSNPTVELRESSERVHCTIDASVKVTGTSEALTGQASLSAGVSYRPEEGTFYLDNARIDEMEIGALPSRYLQPVTRVVNIISDDVIETIPIYTLDQDKLGQRAVKLVLKEVAIADNELVLTMGR